MANLHGFNAQEVEPQQDFEPIPAGRYLVVITHSEMRPTRNGNGAYLQFTFQILEGPHKGRKLWSRLNLENPSSQTVQIAKSELSAICRAVGVLRPGDSCDLHNLPLLVSVITKPRSDTGQLQNEIRGYAPQESDLLQPAQATSDTPPWRR